MNRNIGIAKFGFVFGALLSVSAYAGEPSSAKAACSPSENWALSEAIGPTFASSFMSTLSGKDAPVLGFGRALAMRRISQSAEPRALAEYWISRSLYDAKMIHIAYDGFSAILGKKVEKETRGVQLAALECLLRIRGRYPSAGLPELLAAKLPELASFGATDVTREAAATLLLQQLGDSRVSSATIQRTLELLRDAGPYEAFARGLWAARNGEHGVAVQRLEELFRDPAFPAPLKRFADELHLVMARSYYSSGRFEAASAQLKLVSKSSNELAASLSELGWAYLQAEQYSEAIGTAMNLQAGGMRHTFAPEAPMVMAMALNELCQYPESVRAISVFRRKYEAPYNWLTAWDSSTALYPLAVQYLKKTGKVPEKIASEWVRSPVFISHQDEVNLIFDEKESAQGVARRGMLEQRRLAESIVKLIETVKPKIRKFRSVPANEELPLPALIASDVAELRRQLLDLKRLHLAAPTWRKVLAHGQQKSGAIQSRLIARIEADLKARSLRMKEQLDEIAENLQLVEVEIYNGASQDIIWQNAHPDYKKVAQSLKNDAQKGEQEKTWDWGNSGAITEENAEIWEDELGSFKANLYDNCSSKERYLALRMKRSGGS